jgi:MOSC domain-containing protein YiiM
VSINIGAVEVFTAPDGSPLRTGIRKMPMDSGLLQVDGFSGDASSEAGHHTPAKAVHLFGNEHYPVVEGALGTQLPRPAFGENLITARLLEQDVYVGDELRIGEALIGVTRPTERCRTIGRRLGVPRILKVLHQFEACGFYARVIEPGKVSVMDIVHLHARPQAIWSIKRLHQIMFRDLCDDCIVGEVMRIPELCEDWKRRLEVMRGRARRGEPLSSSLAEI